MNWSLLWDLCSLCGSYCIEETECLDFVVIARYSMKRQAFGILCLNLPREGSTCNFTYCFNGETGSDKDTGWME